MHLEDAIDVLVNGDGNTNAAAKFAVGTLPIGGTAGTLTYILNCHETRLAVIENHAVKQPKKLGSPT